MDSRPVYIVDSSCWIDGDIGRIIRLMFRLPVQWAVTSFVVRELEVKLQGTLKNSGVQEIPLDDKAIRRLAELSLASGALSPADLSCLIASEDMKVPLITGDRALRARAEAQGLAVHGILWVLDQLVAREIMDPTRAQNAVRMILDGGGRLPPDEVERRLKGRWG
jgi:predicted nucleic acid-binding protein